jgi:uncharacterized protein YndB with AHSA1/START domain
MNDDCVRVTTFVAVDPSDAFEIFTKETDAWWRQGHRFRRISNGSLRFENHERLIEVADDGTQQEIGRVLVWEPGQRLTFEWRAQNFAAGELTEVDVRFEAASGGTRLVLEHRGFGKLRKDHPVRHGLEGDAFVSMMGLWWGDLVTNYRSFAGTRAINSAGASVAGT